jgi:hypothetical protein
MKPSYGLILFILAPLLAGCEQLGIETPATEAAREEAEGKAIGSACRQSGRALEDCYQINRKAPKAAIFTGWREMDAYMRENKIEEIKPDSGAKPAAESGAPPQDAAKEAAGSDQQKQAAKNGAANSKSPAGKDDKAQDASPADPAPARRARPALAH